MSASDLIDSTRCTIDSFVEIQICFTVPESGPRIAVRLRLRPVLDVNQNYTDQVLASYDHFDGVDAPVGRSDVRCTLPVAELQAAQKGADADVKTAAKTVIDDLIKLGQWNKIGG